MSSSRKYRIEQTTVEKPQEKDWLPYNCTDVDTAWLDDLCQVEGVAHSFSIGGYGRWVRIIDIANNKVIWREYKGKKT